MSDRTYRAEGIVPFDDAHELSVVSAMLENSDVFRERLADKLNPSHFLSSRAKTMLVAGLDCLEHQGALNTGILLDKLVQWDQLLDAGGREFVQDLTGNYNCSISQAEGELAIIADRAAIRLGDAAIQRLAELTCDPLTRPEQVINCLEAHAAQIKSTIGLGSMVADRWREVFARGTLDAASLQDLVITPRKKLLADWFCESDLGFIFAARGVGKTWLSLMIALAVSEGRAAGPWQAHESQPVLYIDGEMPLELMQARHAALSHSPQKQTNRQTPIHKTR